MIAQRQAASKSKNIKYMSFILFFWLNPLGLLFFPGLSKFQINMSIFLTRFLCCFWAHEKKQSKPKYLDLFLLFLFSIKKN